MLMISSLKGCVLLANYSSEFLYLHDDGLQEMFHSGSTPVMTAAKVHQVVFMPEVRLFRPEYVSFSFQPALEVGDISLRCTTERLCSLK